MLDTQKLFEDIEAMTQATARQHLPVAGALAPWFQYCNAVDPLHASVWQRLAQLDIEADVQRLSEWMAGLMQAEPIPAEINGLWVGLYNPCLEDGEPTCQFYLAGSSRFDKSDPHSDWHCQPAYWPEGRYANSEVMTAFYQSTESLGEDGMYLAECVLCHGYVAAVVAQWCHGPLATPLLGLDRQRAVAMGHDSGDIHVIRLPD